MTVVFFPPTHSPLHCLYPWMRGLFDLTSGFPLCTVTPVLLSISWLRPMAVFFFHLSLRGNDFWLGEMREERQTNISYFWTRLRCTLQTISLPIYPDRCQTFVSATFCYSTKSPYKHLWLLQWDIQQLILEYYWTTVFYVDWHVLMYILPTIQSLPLIPCDVFKSYSYCYVLKQRLYLPPVLFFHILLFIVNCCGAPASNLALTSL